MSYQDRKDIDNLYDLIWDFDKNQTQFASREEFEEFKKYVKINYSMSALTEAIASNMDENGLIIFENLQDGLSELETNLDGLKSNLINLSGQLNGDATHTGFINQLTNLQHHLYGEGDEDGEGNPYTYAYPSSSSLKGLLDALRGSLGELSAGDTQLAVTLSDLKSKLVSFSGNLTQFKNQIRQELGETAYEQLNQDLLELIFTIAKTNNQIDDHQGRIQATETLIGTESDSASEQDGTTQNPYTVFGILNDTSDLASETNDSANGLLDLMYRGTDEDYDPDATPTSPADNTTLQWLGDTSRTANKVDGYVGDVSKFAETTISDALKNRAEGQTAINNKIGNTTFTGNTLTGAIASLQTNIGVVNIGNLASTVGSINSNIGNTNIGNLASTVGSINSNIGNTDVQGLANKVGNVTFTGNSVTGAISSLQTNIGAVNIGGLASTVDSIDSNIGNTDVQGLANTVGNTSFTGASLTGAIASMQTQIGTVNINGSVTNAINSLQTSIGNVNILGGSSVSLALYNSILNIGDVSLFSGESLSLALGNAQGDIGGVNRSNGDKSLQTQIKELPCYIEKLWISPSNSTNEVIKLSSTGTARIGIKFTEVAKKTLRDGGEVMFSPVIVSPSNVISGQNEYIVLDSNSTLPSNKILYINHNFNEVGLWKILCENLSYTVQVGELQTAIPNFTNNFVLKETRTDICGLTAKTYSDGLNVYFTISGTLDGSSAIPNQNNDAIIGGLLNSDYAPFVEMQTTVHSSPNLCKIRLTPTGSIYLTNGNSSKTYSINGALYYPLKSRMP